MARPRERYRHAARRRNTTQLEPVYLVQANGTQLEVISGGLGSLLKVDLSNPELFPLPPVSVADPGIVEALVAWVGGLSYSGGTAIASSNYTVNSSVQTEIGYVQQVNETLYVIVQKRFEYIQTGTVVWQVLSALSGNPIITTTTSRSVYNRGAQMYCLAVNVESGAAAITSSLEQAGSFTVSGVTDAPGGAAGPTAPTLAVGYQPLGCQSAAQAIAAALPSSHPLKTYGASLWAGPQSGTGIDSADAASKVYELMTLNGPSGSFAIYEPPSILSASFLNASLRGLYGLLLADAEQRRLIQSSNVLQLSTVELNLAAQGASLGQSWASSFGSNYNAADLQERSILLLDGIAPADQNLLLSVTSPPPSSVPAGTSTAGVDSDHVFFQESSAFVTSPSFALASAAPEITALLGYEPPSDVFFYPRYRIVD